MKLDRGQNFVIAFHHFGTPILLFESSFSGFDSSKCQFVSAFYEVDSGVSKTKTYKAKT